MSKVYKGAIQSDLIIEKGDDASQVTSIGGSLYVRQGATCDLPQVTSIGGFLEIKPRSKLVAPKLETIHGQPVGDPETQGALLKQVAEAALADPKNFIMNDWHNESGGCGTAHCVAGWAVHLAGEDGYALEKAVGPATAGALLLGTDAASMFFLSRDEATARLEMIRQGVA